VLAALIGGARHTNAISTGRQDRYGRSADNGWSDHYEGACGEIAFCKAFNLYWAAKVKASGTIPDVDPDIQVKTARKHHYKLILHPEDDDEQRFIHVTGLWPHFRVVGWIMAWDGKDEAYWKEPVPGRPAFFVPSEKLMTIETFQRPDAEILRKKFSLEP
jgi:hypothetical protein